MIDVQPVTTGAMLTLDENQPANSDLTRQYDEIVDRLLTKDLEYIEDEGECPGKDEQELEDDIANMDTAPLELDETPELQEELAQLPTSPTLETVSILRLPTTGAEENGPSRRVSMRRRRSEDQDENTPNTADAGESDAVMTYLREIGRVRRITHDREIQLAKRVEAVVRQAMKQFTLANRRRVGSMSKHSVRRGSAPLALIQQD